MGRGFGVHTMTSIADIENYVGAGFEPRNLAAFEAYILRLDGQETAGGHGVVRVNCQVHDHLLDLACIGAHLREIFSEIAHQRDILADQARQ